MSRVLLAAGVTVLAFAGFRIWEENHRASGVRGKVYRIGVDINPPSQDWSAQRGASGFTVDVMNEAARRAAVQLQWVLCTRSSRAALLDGTIDLWPAGYYHPGMYPTLHQTRPWTHDQHAIVWDRGRFRDEPPSWDGKTLEVYDRMGSRVLAQRLFPGMRIVPAPSRRAAIRAMCFGEVDVAFVDLRVLENALLERPEPCKNTTFYLKMMPKTDDPMTIFARPEAAGAAEMLRTQIDTMIADGTVLRYSNHWFSFSNSDLRQALQLQESVRRLRWLAMLCVLLSLATGLLFWLVRNLRRARTAADRARRLQAEFLANVSHEIRTPMNGILGTADLLMDSIETPDLREHIEIIRESAYTQLELLNQILDQSKIDSGALLLETTPFSLRRLVEHVEKTFQPMARKKGITLHVEIGAEIPELMQGDGLRLKQVLTNLVNNAVKFTDKGEVGILLTGVVAQGLVEVQFFVTDTGIGIPRAVQDTIFEKFRQVDASTTRRYGGSGLGLSISRQLVRLMGGELTVESEPGKGSRFGFRLQLPVAKKIEREAVRVTGKPADLNGLSVLLVEDNAVNQRVAQALLRRLGAGVEVAANGLEAVEKCRGRAFDVILMDCHMPGMDGYEATAAIRRLAGAVGRTPIIALTAGVSGEERQRALQAGMDGFLAKPVNPEELASALLSVRYGSFDSCNPSTDTGQVFEG